MLLSTQTYKIIEYLLLILELYRKGEILPLLKEMFLICFMIFELNINVAKMLTEVKVG